LDDRDRSQGVRENQGTSRAQRIRLEHIEAGDQSIDLVTRRTTLQRDICQALAIDTSTWDRASLS
jgi:hypothetical protein